MDVIPPILIDAQRGSDWCAPEASEHVGQFLLYGRSGTMADLSAALRVDLDARHEALQCELGARVADV